MDRRFHPRVRPQHGAGDSPRTGARAERCLSNMALDYRARRLRGVDPSSWTLRRESAHVGVLVNRYAASREPVEVGLGIPPDRTTAPGAGRWQDRAHDAVIGTQSVARASVREDA